MDRSVAAPVKALSGGLTFVNVATVCAVLLGMAAGGLRTWIAVFGIFFGLAAAAMAWFQTSNTGSASPEPSGNTDSTAQRFGPLWFWLLAACFAFFAFRSFCWLLFSEGNQLKVQSPNNLGDLSLHITYIKNFANGVPLWPDNPIHAFSKLRYPAGTDIFNALLVLLGIDFTRGLIWAGLIGSLATFYALYRWGGVFTVAGFLFNGGLAGFQVLQSFHFLDYQGVSSVAWKNLPLSMLVTQRGLLYALPAGLLLLYHWRAKYFAIGSRGGVVAAREVVARNDGPGSTRAAKQTASRSHSNQLQREGAKPPLPFWVELTLYATMPLFHLHTFMALSIVAAFFFLLGDASIRKQLAMLVGSALLPATFFVWSITDHFQARSLLKWHPGWVQANGDFASPFFKFWLSNFGLFIPLVLAFGGVLIWRAMRLRRFDFRSEPALAFLAPAAAIFFFACLVKTAPWEWDNIKLIIWAYLIVLPFLWTNWIGRWPTPVRAGVCLALFTSGFVSLFGGLAANRTGYNIADRAELDGVGSAVRKLPVEARFAAFPTYNHPLLLQGRKVVLGYPGHLWTQGFDYAPIEKQLASLMQGGADWREQAKQLGVRYLFWGREEKSNYAASTRPWEREAQLIATGTWGAIYDLETPRS